jgi:hypothetical protein
MACKEEMMQIIGYCHKCYAGNLMSPSMDGRGESVGNGDAISDTGGGAVSDAARNNRPDNDGDKLRLFTYNHSNIYK